MPPAGSCAAPARLPVAHPSTAGVPEHADTWCLPPSTRSRTSNDPASVRAHVDLVHALKLVGDPSRSPTICSVAPAPRDADSQPPKAAAFRGPVPESPRSLRPALLPSRAHREIRRCGPSIGTSSKGTFCATLIITCCNLAFGPKLTSQTLLPGFLRGQVRGLVQRQAAQGSSTAGNTISFFIPGPFGPVNGSSVCSGSGTIPAQTTMWKAVAIVMASLRDSGSQLVAAFLIFRECKSACTRRELDIRRSPSGDCAQFHRHAPQ